MNVAYLAGFLKGMVDSGYGQVKIIVNDPDDNLRLLWVLSADFRRNTTPGHAEDDPGFLYFEVGEEGQ